MVSSTSYDDGAMHNTHQCAGTNYKVMKKAFDEGWGGVICKTLSLDSSKVVNVTPRYARMKASNGEVIGWENIELISDRPFETMLDEMKQLKLEYPNRYESSTLTYLLSDTDSLWCHLPRTLGGAALANTLLTSARNVFMFIVKECRFQKRSSPKKIQFYVEKNLTANATEVEISMRIL